MDKYHKFLKETQKVSSRIGRLPDLVQGGGGNISIKISDDELLIKASGLTLKEAATDGGFVAVNYKKIKNYYHSLRPRQNFDFDGESVNFLLANTKNVAGRTLRPSMETGFHSFLDKCVIHTHSVYANILNCSKEGKSLLPKIFKEDSKNILWIPYATPGFHLALLLMKKVSEFETKFGILPPIIFLQNHGLVITGRSLNTCSRLQKFVDGSIRDHFKIRSKFPNPQIALRDKFYVGDTEYLKRFFKENQKADFNKRLFPDQVVYLSESLSFFSGVFNEPESKINVNTETGEVVYDAGEKEALAIEETLLAYAYILETIRSLGLQPVSISKGDTDYLDNMESEKYRRGIVKNKFV